jgi:superfamily II DNA/RNA helicase
MDHLGRGNLNLEAMNTLVLDEADRMLDIGFLPDLQRILSYLPKQRTTLLFSATFSPEIKRLASSYLQNPITIEVARPNETASNVEQRFYSANDDDKRRAIHQVLRTRGIKQAFIFVNSKLGCARLARSLEREGLKTTALHGDKSQDERLKALDAFKQGEVDLLVCTDVAARGLDIKDVPAVFNFDVPFNAEDYVHRIGRTGRAGASGLAVTLVSGSDARLVADIEKLLKTKLDIEALEYDEDRPNIQQQGRINDGRRAWREGGASAEPRNDAARRDAAPRERERREPREPREYRGFRPAVASRDPFFEKPYESSAADVAPAWEAAAKSPARSGVSANIKPKRKVAALFKAVPPETAVAAQSQPETSDQ